MYAELTKHDLLLMIQNLQTQVKQLADQNTEISQSRDEETERFWVRPTFFIRPDVASTPRSSCSSLQSDNTSGWTWWMVKHGASSYYRPLLQSNLQQYW